MKASSSSPGDAIGLGGPITPAVTRFNGGLELFRNQTGFLFALQFEIIQKLEEHDPSEQRQAVQVSIEPLVLAHDVARRFDQSAEGLNGGGRHNII